MDLIYALLLGVLIPLIPLLAVIALYTRSCRKRRDRAISDAYVAQRAQRCWGMELCDREKDVIALEKLVIELTKGNKALKAERDRILAVIEGCGFRLVTFENNRVGLVGHGTEYHVPLEGGKDVE